MGVVVVDSAAESRLHLSRSSPGRTLTHAEHGTVVTCQDHTKSSAFTLHSIVDSDVNNSSQCAVPVISDKRNELSGSAASILRCVFAPFQKLVGEDKEVIKMG